MTAKRVHKQISDYMQELEDKRILYEILPVLVETDLIKGKLYQLFINPDIIFSNNFSVKKNYDFLNESYVIFLCKKDNKYYLLNKDGKKTIFLSNDIELDSIKLIEVNK